MIEKELFIRADIFYIKIITKCEFLENFIQDNINEFERLTINFKVVDVCEKIDTVLQYNDEDIYDFSCVDNKFIFKCPWNRINNSTIFPMIFRYIVEVLRQNNNEIKVHASSIMRNDYSSLFFAPSEGGKTTIAMAMCQKYQCILKSNDATVVKFNEGKPYVYRGDHVFKVRANGLKTYSKEIYNKKMKINSDTPWLDKAKILPEDVGVNTDDNITEIKYIFFVKLDTLIDGCTVKKYNRNNPEETDNWFKPKMQIFQNISGTIRGTDLIPIGNDGKIIPLNLPSLDNEELAIKRIEFINNLFEECDVYQLRGQLEDMTMIINDIMSKK